MANSSRQDPPKTGYQSSLRSGKALFENQEPQQRQQTIVHSKDSTTLKFGASDHSKFTKYPVKQPRVAFSSISAAFEDHLLDSVRASEKHQTLTPY